MISPALLPGKQSGCPVLRVDMPERSWLVIAAETSQARCLSVLLANPSVFTANIRTI